MTESTTTQATPSEAEAAKLIQDTYANHGRGTLSCDCGAWEAYIDGDAVGSSADTARIKDLIEHARFDHVGPRAVLFTAPIIVLELSR